MKQLEVGDLVEYRKGGSSFLTLGKVYSVIDTRNNDIRVINDNGDRWWVPGDSVVLTQQSGTDWSFNISAVLPWLTSIRSDSA